ncbi:hypothetical protein WJX72_007815 [[Myrmecia] bisecta]|uniref:Uncharacterized protein n=1 Tax=[Myrmecia] bisecta TaxID=41462 RepID=A0AAW1P7C3_9CHLO
MEQTPSIQSLAGSEERKSWVSIGGSAEEFGVYDDLWDGQQSDTAMDFEGDAATNEEYLARIPHSKLFALTNTALLRTAREHGIPVLVRVRLLFKSNTDPNILKRYMYYAAGNIAKDVASDDLEPPLFK